MDVKPPVRMNRQVYFRMLDYGKRALDKAGINIPYPQMDVLK